jgi:hypothetical protein
VVKAWKSSAIVSGVSGSMFSCMVRAWGSGMGLGEDGCAVGGGLEAASSGAVARVHLHGGAMSCSRREAMLRQE